MAPSLSILLDFTGSEEDGARLDVQETIQFPEVKPSPIQPGALETSFMTIWRSSASTSSVVSSTQMLEEGKLLLSMDSFK